jgi:uncharacterized membrane protein YcjF (UPF0283 family)
MEKFNDRKPLKHLNEYVQERELDVDDDDDEDKEAFEVDSTTMGETDKLDARRDEVGEVRKMSSKDTNRLRLWRLVVTGVLFLTAFAVTFTTYSLLEQQEEENFKTAVCLLIVFALSRVFLFSLQTINLKANLGPRSN